MRHRLAYHRPFVITDEAPMADVSNDASGDAVVPNSDLTDRDKRLLVIGDHARALLECLGQLPEDTDLPGHIWAALGKLREGAEAIRCDPVFRD